MFEVENFKFARFKSKEDAGIMSQRVLWVHIQP